MKPPLRILMVLHMPWTRDLGAPRCFVELADEFRAVGHAVDKFDLDDALPQRGRLTANFEKWLFARRAVRHVSRVGRKYDVILAAQADLPVPRERLNFPGVLVTRSDGLVHFFAAFERRAGRPRGRLAGRVLRYVAGRLWDEVAAAEATFKNADLITLLNNDELAVVQRLSDRVGEKAIVLPNGLSRGRLAEFESARRPDSDRLAAGRVAFVGAWTDRKGKTDLPVIVRAVRTARPSATFRLLGTGAAADEVRAAFAPDDRAAVKVVPRFTSNELPILLADVTVGLLPSYIEGFPMAVLEMLAAGLPVVSYDVPGPREMLRDWPVPLLVRAGDAVAAADRLGDLLAADPARYISLAVHARGVADRCRWSEISRVLLGRWGTLLQARAGGTAP